MINKHLLNKSGEADFKEINTVLGDICYDINTFKISIDTKGYVCVWCVGMHARPCQQLDVVRGGAGSQSWLLFLSLNPSRPI